MNVSDPESSTVRTRALLGGVSLEERKTRRSPARNGEAGLVVRAGPFERSPRDRRKTDILQEGEACFRGRVPNSFDIITIHDSSGVTMYESPAASRILGYPPSTLIGKTPFETLHPKDVARARQAFDALLKGGGPVAPVVMRFRHADGSWIHLEALGNNLLDHPGIRGIVLTSGDIRDRKRAEERVQYLAHFDVLPGLPTRFLMSTSKFARYCTRSSARLRSVISPTSTCSPACRTAS